MEVDRKIENKQPLISVRETNEKGIRVVLPLAKNVCQICTEFADLTHRLMALLNVNAWTSSFSSPSSPPLSPSLL